MPSTEGSVLMNCSNKFHISKPIHKRKIRITSGQTHSTLLEINYQKRNYIKFILIDEK